MHGMSRATAGVTGERLPLVYSTMRAAFVPTTKAEKCPRQARNWCSVPSERLLLSLEQWLRILAFCCRGEEQGR